MSSEDRIAELERKLLYLTDRQEILDCLVRNARGNDRFDAALTTTTYHPDGVHQLGQSFIPGPEYGDHANHAHAVMCDACLHNVTMQSCDIDGDTAHAESYSLGLFLMPGGERAQMLAGRYVDRLERRGGEWRIVVRRVTVEVAMDGQAMLPNGKPLPGSGYLKGSRGPEDLSYHRPLTLEGGEVW